MFIFTFVLRMMAERAALKPTVNAISVYLIIYVVWLFVSSSSSLTLYHILYHLPLSDTILHGKKYH